jgi:hypothetical protein
MQIPKKKSKSFSGEDIEILNSWLQEMGKSPVGQRIIKNIKNDPHVSKNFQKQFFKNLINQIKAGRGGIDALDKAITDKMLLKGTKVHNKNLKERFSRIIRVEDLFRYLKTNSKLFFNDKDDEKRFCEWLEKGIITIKESFENVELRGQKPVVWATFADDIEKGLLLNDGNIDDLCDILGLSDFEECDYLADLRYNSGKIKEVHFPTVLEAGGNPTFEPSDKDDDYGYTLDIRNCDFGMPEVVHKPILFQSIETISCIGHKDRDATPLSYDKLLDESKNSEEINE